MARRSTLPLPLELAAGALGKLLYRVRSSGMENVPAKGGAILVANHLSYVDVVVLQMACPRPIRFMAYEGPGLHGFLSWVYRRAGVIPLAADSPNAGMHAALRALRQGELVCIFPEGEISRTGQLMEVRKGFEVLARRAEVPVIPVAIDGLWGSVYSFAGNKYLWKSPRLMPTDVFIAVGSPIRPEEAGTAQVRRALLDLGAEAFEQRPVLRRHIGREAIRNLSKAPWRTLAVDCTAARRKLTSGKLMVVTAVLARRIRRTIPERRVGIVLPPGAGSFVANLAVVCAGKIPVNLNFTAGRSAVGPSMEMGGVRTVLSAEAMRERLPEFPWPDRTLDLRVEIKAALAGGAALPWLAAVWLLPNQWIPGLMGLPRTGDRAEAALLFTSGSAGEPKGVVLTHRNILSNCAQISSLSVLPRNCTMLGCLPLFHSFGFLVTIWYPLLRGCRVVTVPSPLDTRKMIDAIRDEKVTVMVGAPTFLRPILKKATSLELASLELVVAGAEKLPDDMYRQFLETFHIEILQGYGLTETSPVTSVNQHHPPITTATARHQDGKKMGTVGRILPGMTARVIDVDTGADLPLTKTGILCLRGANVFPGYLDNTVATDSVMRDGWLVTGDVGHFDEDGFLTIDGRVSRFSKIGGEMVPHGRVEQKLVEVMAIDQLEGPLITVLGIPDTAKGESLVLVTALPLELSVVRDRLAEAGLPNLWIPRHLQHVEKIPLLATGKIDLKACRAIAMRSAAGVN
jgi:acyl-[acyl-carrier-protein]-phospholipid O-acyltransferase/long-chain-fatty-acid--[acyl-carrier-protein] ligase